MSNGGQDHWKGCTGANDLTLLIKSSDNRCGPNWGFKEVSLYDLPPVLEQSHEILKHGKSKIEGVVRKKRKQLVRGRFVCEDLVRMLEAKLFRMLRRVFVNFAEYVQGIEDRPADVYVDFGIVL